MNSLSEEAQLAARAHWDSIAKPLHSLGKLEDLLVQIAGIQGTEKVQLTPRCVLVFCADHGVVAEGVSQSGQEVTAAVAKAVAEGTSNVNLMAEGLSDVWGIDVGMSRDVPGIINRKIAYGTQNMAKAPAMTRQQAEAALKTGMDLVGELKAKGYHMAAVGEMGIGNTTASTAVCCALLGLSPEEVAGRGAGLSDAGLIRKKKAIETALALHQPDPKDAVDVLAKVGGFEIAAMAGAFLGGMVHGMPIVMDGVISGVAALAAARICPAAKGFMVPSHMSREPAALRIMKELQLAPILQADMALGEGTGAVALFPLLDMACKVYSGVHTFEHTGIEAYTPQEGK